jgi:hypothetical protein
MKSRVFVIGVSCGCGGFLLGWLMFSRSDVKALSTTASTGLSYIRQRETEGKEHVASRARADEPEAETEQDATDLPGYAVANADERDRNVERYRRRFTAQLAEWTAALHLTAEQQEKLNKAIRDELVVMESNWGNGGFEPSIEVATQLDGSALEAEVAKLLDESQRAPFQQWRQEQQDVRHEASAITSLSSLQSVVKMTTGQRGLVLERLNKLAADDGSSLPPPPSGQVDTAFLQEISAKLPKGGDLQSAAVAVVRARITRQTEALKDLLSADQLDDYRLYLEEQQQAWLKSPAEEDAPLRPSPGP